MGTRSGDIDHFPIFYLINALGYSSEEVNWSGTEKKWYVWSTGIRDLRIIETEAEKGNKMSVSLSHECLSNQKYISAYSAVRNGLDAIILLLEWKFNHKGKLVCTEMDYFGIHLDEAKKRNWIQRN
jgi:acetate kinase